MSSCSSQRCRRGRGEAPRAVGAALGVEAGHASLGAGVVEAPPASWKTSQTSMPRSTSSSRATSTSATASRPVDRTRGGGGDAGAEDDRGRRAGRRELDDPEVLAVGRSASSRQPRRLVELLGPVDVGHGHTTTSSLKPTVPVAGDVALGVCRSAVLMDASIGRCRLPRWRMRAAVRARGFPGRLPGGAPRAEHAMSAAAAPSLAVTLEIAPPGGAGARPRASTTGVAARAAWTTTSTPPKRRVVSSNRRSTSSSSATSARMASAGAAGGDSSSTTASASRAGRARRRSRRRSRGRRARARARGRSRTSRR